MNSLLVVALALLTNTVLAQMSLTGEIRPRTEYRHGYKSLLDTGQTKALFTEQRTRLNLYYGAEKYKAGISVQDVRIWGSQPQLNKADGLFSLHEAWGEYFFSQKFSAKLGRQELQYNDERLFGGVNWTQQGRNHDLLLFKFSDSTFTAHAGMAYNQNAETTVGTAYTVANNYKAMQFVWLNKLMNRFAVSFLFVNNGIQSPVSINSTRYSQTFGAHTEFKKDKLFVMLRGYYQTGTDGITKNRINAYFAGADVGYTLQSKLTFTIGCEILSGQSQSDTTQSYSDVNHSFNPLYGTAHKFNGYMDYFYVGNHINTVGLNDLYFRAKYKSEKWWMSLDVHQFLAQAEVVDAAYLAQTGMYVTLAATLGTEADFTFGYNLTNEVTFQAGYSQMFATETMETLKGGSKDETNNWAYLMLTFKPEFYKTKVP